MWWPFKNKTQRTYKIRLENSLAARIERSAAQHKQTPTAFLEKFLQEEFYVPPFSPDVVARGKQLEALSLMNAGLDRADALEDKLRGGTIKMLPSAPPPAPGTFEAHLHPCSRLDPTVPRELKYTGCQGLCSLMRSPCYWQPHIASGCGEFVDKTKKKR